MDSDKTATPFQSASPWTEVAEYSSFEEAEIVRGMLQANGIPCVVNNATIASVYPMTSTWTPLQLMVPTPLAQEARKLLEHDDDIQN